jgi:hypothetical protein
MPSILDLELVVESTMIEVMAQGADEQSQTFVIIQNILQPTAVL